MAAKPNRLNAGVTFGKLTVISDTEQRTALCQCSCGSLPKEILRTSLRFGSTKSCGCREPRLGMNAKHGLSRTTEYLAWASMIARCTNPNHPSFHRYGGRGISVCSDWLIVENFFKDMGPRPSAMSLDRINNELGYNPTNCRWVTHKTNCQNTSASRIWILNGVEYPSAIDAAKVFGVSPSTICGWCNGHTTAGKKYLAKKGCESRLLYQDAILHKEEVTPLRFA